MNTDLAAAAEELSECLRLHEQRIVFAESCTGGRVSAELCCIPGISKHLCGSFVVYRNASKSGWLGVPTELLSDPKRGPVSDDASRELAKRALEATPEADICVAVTGDVGPGAPAETDGRVFLAAATRTEGQRSRCVQLTEPYSGQADVGRVRRQRLASASEAALRFAIAVLQNDSESG